MPLHELDDIEYPAVVIVHWPGQSVACCERHAKKLMNVANSMGLMFVATTIAPLGSVCTNCVNEGER